MANYVFENITQSDASNFTASDFLYFTSGSVANLGVVDAPATTTTTALGSTVTNESITLTNGGKSLIFSATALSTASQTANHVVFLSSSDTLLVGTDAANDTISAASFGTAGKSTALFGFGGTDFLTGGNGNDTINGGEGNDSITGASSTTDASGRFTESDYLLGGNGADTINGGVGNDHIYGNLFTSTAGAADGNDVINAGNGNDYVNGNAGNDSIDGGLGNDRLYGGNGNDTILGSDGNDYLQGNKGDDSLDGGLGIDELHGGQGNDILRGAGDNDAVFGELGDDTIYGGAGYDKLTGGAGNDTFNFNTAGDASNANILTAATAASHDVTDQITDFTDGQDLISLGSVGYLVHTGAGVTFSSVDQAQIYAEQLLDAHTGGGEVAAITVGADTYLFYRDDAADITGAVGASINAVIKVVGVSDAIFGAATDFS